MKSNYQITTALSVAMVLFSLSTCSAEDWTQFRGPNGTGISTSSAIPLEWSAEKNISWSIELPGPGSSSPIVVGDKVFVTCYTGYGEDKANPGDVANLVRHLIAFDRATGKEIWRATTKSDNDEDTYKGFIQDHGYASSTPVSDGKQLFVLFGKTGVVAFDMDGKQLWKTNVGTKSDPAKWGGGTSCMLYKDLVIVNAGIVGHAVVALNKADGKEVWRLDNPKFTNCWSTPNIVNVDNHDELVCSMPGQIIGLDPLTGIELWSAKSPIARTVCGSLAVDGDIVYAMGGQQGDAIAVRCGGKGDVTESNVLWTSSLRSGIGTPIIADGNLVWTSGGIAYCANCEDGQYVYKERVKGQQGGARRRGPAGDYASPVSVGDHIVLLTRNGTAYVVKAGKDFNLVSTNSFPNDTSQFNASPAVSNGQLFIRSNKMLHCIGKENNKTKP